MGPVGAVWWRDAGAQADVDDSAGVRYVFCFSRSGWRDGGSDRYVHSTASNGGPHCSRADAPLVGLASGVALVATRWIGCGSRGMMDSPLPPTYLLWVKDEHHVHTSLVLPLCQCVNKVGSDRHGRARAGWPRGADAQPCGCSRIAFPPPPFNPAAASDGRRRGGPLAALGRPTRTYTIPQQGSMGQ